jgi:glycosyltransferase involved in cell wall biosynthesis
MNILFICNEYPPGKSGGIGSITRSLARQLSSMGHNIYVAGLYIPGYGEKDYEEDQGVKIWRKRLFIDKGLIKNNYSFTDTILLKLFRASGILGWDTTRSIHSFYEFLLTLIEEKNIEVIEWPDFNEFFYHLSSAGKWPLKPLPIPLIVKLHGTSSYINNQIGEAINPKVYSIEKKHLEQADALVSVSKNTAENYKKFYGITQPIKVLYNSIDIPPYLYDTESTSQTIVFTGTLTRLKGIYSLLRAWNIVHKKNPSAMLRIYGKGLSKNLIKEIDPSALSSVRFEGFVTRDVLYHTMATASAAIFPSFTECFAIAPLEAMAVGCPVIYTSRVSGPELITNEVNGLLVDPENYQQIAESITTLLENQAMRKQFSIEGRKTIENHFTITQSAKDHLNFYSQVISYYNDQHASAS